MPKGLLSEGGWLQQRPSRPARPHRPKVPRAHPGMGDKSSPARPARQRPSNFALPMKNMGDVQSGLNRVSATLGQSPTDYSARRTKVKKK